MKNPENLTPPTVSEMLRLTGANQAQFMEQVALHVDKLEEEILRLQARVAELEQAHNATN